MMLRGALAIFWRDLIVLRRSLLSELLAVVASPLTLYLAFGFGLKGYISSVDGVPYSIFIAPGLISMTAVLAAFEEGAWSMWFHRRVQKTIEEYRVTPVTVYDIVVGKLISGFFQGGVKGVAVAVIIFILTPFRFPSAHLFIYLLFIGLGAMIFSCLGTICGTVMDKPESLGRIQTVIIMPLIFMSGIFFPLSSYPPAVLPYIRLLPTTALFEGARMALLSGRGGMLPLVILLVTAPVMFVLAVVVFNKKIEE